MKPTLTLNVTFALVLFLAAFFGAPIISDAQGTENALSQDTKPATMQKTFTNAVGMEFALISPGTFIMGSSQSPPEQPVHEVTITQPFYIGKYEVTQAQGQEVMGKNPSAFKKCGLNCPVEMVGWDNIQAFISKLNSQGGDHIYRLPTEAEWEYAARAGTTGDYAGDINLMAWYGKNSGYKTHPVGTQQPNAWGLYDMHGNVAEYLLDTWHENYKGAPADGSEWQGGDATYRVVRGGSWGSKVSYTRSAVRAGFRGYDGNTGFRVVAVARNK
jgi:formylglycine-generating enzyme required for sulfatase activity